ncbi:MAG: NrfD/PsrC family molybdoenzyme membrane anchor subunit, partial [Planctomycetota bacterium]
MNGNSRANHATPPLGEDAVLAAPIVRTTFRFYIFSGVLLAITIMGVVAYLHQYRNGLGVTGLNRPVYWGVYITNFVFFIGISHAGTLISAILRIVRAEWRRAITRSAEVITVMVLVFGVGSILIDLGRPDRLFNVIYLYLPLIPDIAILRDHTNCRRWLYRVLALGWQGTPKQERALGILMAVFAVLVIPVAVSV